MTLKGTFCDGVIVPEDSGLLRNGDLVDIRVRRRTSLSRKGPGRKKAAGNAKQTGPKRPAAPRGLTGQQRLALFMRSFGMWRDKPEWHGRSSAHIARELRRRTPRGTTRG